MLVAESEKLRRYLLGSLPEDVQREIDMRIIEDEGFSSALLTVENDLIEEYLDGDLTPSELDDFESSYLTTHKRRELVEQVASLRRYAVQEKHVQSDADTNEIVTGRVPSFFERFFRPAFVAVAAAAVIIIGIAIWQAFFVVRLSPLELEYAQMNRKDLSDLTTIGDGAINLVGGLLRDSGSPAAKRADTLPDKVLFRLLLPAGPTDKDKFSVTLLKGREQIFRIDEIQSYQNQSGREVRVLLPRSELVIGQYQIRVESGSMSSPINYPFLIY